MYAASDTSKEAQTLISCLDYLIRGEVVRPKHQNRETPDQYCHFSQSCETSTQLTLYAQQPVQSRLQVSSLSFCSDTEFNLPTNQPNRSSNRSHPVVTNYTLIHAPFFTQPGQQAVVYGLTVGCRKRRPHQSNHVTARCQRHHCHQHL